MATAAQASAQAFANRFNNAFAQAVVEHKKMADSIKQGSQQLAEAIISDLIRIEVEAKICKAALALFSGGGSVVADSAGGGSAAGVASIA